MARGTECAAHSHDARVPQERHHVQPLSRGGPDVRANTTLICANAHGDVHYLLATIEKARGYAGVAEEVKRSFGYGVRRIALQGWQAYEAAFLAGRLEREVLLWTTDGLPREPRSGVPPYSVAVATVERLARRAPLSEVYTDWLSLQCRPAPSPLP